MVEAGLIALFVNLLTLLIAGSIHNYTGHIDQELHSLVGLCIVGVVANLAYSYFGGDLGFEGLDYFLGDVPVLALSDVDVALATLLCLYAEAAASGRTSGL